MSSDSPADSPALSVSLITRNSGDRLAQAIAQARRFAQEVVVGVDAESEDSTWETAVAFADTAYRFRHPNQLAPAHLLALQYCRGRWILRLDDDEHMEEGFERIVPALIANERITHYFLPRKWVVSLSPPEYVHAHPWYPDYQLRLFRNDTSLVWKPPRYHSGYLVAGQGATESRFAILHYEPLICSPERRAQKLKTYGEGEGNRVFEEKTGEHRSFQLVTQRPEIKPNRCRVDSEVKALEARQYAPWGCEILGIDLPRRIVVSQQAAVVLRIKNTGHLTWIPQQQNRWPLLNIGVHLKSEAGAMIENDSGRIAMGSYVLPGETATILGSYSAPAEPGRYVLTWDMVSEGECWFEQCGSKTADTPIEVHRT